MRSYARNVSIAAADETLRDDCASGDESFDKDVFAKYLNALRNLYVIEELPAWNPNLRSKTAIRTKATRHFTDPSIGAAALGVTPEGVFSDITTFGLLFESLVIHDLRVYADTIGAHVYKYRDSKKREADMVIQSARSVFRTPPSFPIPWRSIPGKASHSPIPIRLSG